MLEQSDELNDRILDRFAFGARKNFGLTCATAAIRTQCAVRTLVTPDSLQHDEDECKILLDAARERAEQS